MTLHTLRQAAAVSARKAKKVATLATTLPLAAPGGARDTAVRAVAEGALLGAYEFLAFKSAPTPSSLREIVLLAAGDAAGLLDKAKAVAEATTWARDLVNTPAGAKPPGLDAHGLAFGRNRENRSKGPGRRYRSGRRKHCGHDTATRRGATRGPCATTTT